MSELQDFTRGRLTLWVRLIGGIEARDGEGRSVLPVSKKARALLALVAASMPQPMRRDTAAGLLWSTKSREHAANSLRQALRELQSSLAGCGTPPILAAQGGRLVLQSDRVWVDVHDPAAIRPTPSGDGAATPSSLCQDLHGLDPALDAHLERLWKNLMFQQAFVPPGNEGLPGSGRAGVASSGPRASVMPVEDEQGGQQGWRIAVLPFRCLGSPIENGLSLGMAEEVSAALARFRMPRVIATGSFWDGAGAASDSLARCRAFNLDYAISGTIQTSGPRMRVTVSLLDVGLDFEVVWTSRFEGTTDDLFALQDKIASQTVAQIDPEMLQRQQFHGEVIQTPNAASHRKLLAGIQGLYRPGRTRFLEARVELQAAIGLDPTYAAPHAWLAYWYVNGMAEGWLDDPREAAVHAGTAAERSILLDPLDARGLTIAGHVKAYLERDLKAALGLHKRATSLNPNLPIAWVLSSWARVYNGDHQIAFDEALMAESLSPTDPHVFSVEHAAMTAKFFLRDMEAADRYALSSLDRRPRHATALNVRLAALGHLGRKDDAVLCLRMLQGLGLRVTVDAITSRAPLQERDKAFYADGLRLAGVPQT